MEAKAPTNKIEISLVTKENWEKAQEVRCFWWDDNCKCDICKKQLSGRHMIDGKLRNSFEFGLMCASCHNTVGDGFGEGKGQLYTHLIDGQWIMTFGFSENEF
ncbi:MAG: hypothetical protein WCI92_14115 [Bacteroidota bacterium]